MLNFTLFTNMILSIIIPTKNESKNICNLLDSLIPQLTDEIEVLIADANSDDDTISKINSYNCNKIKIIPGGLPAVGRNNGARVAKSENLLFIDADIVLSKNIISDSINKLNNKNVHLLTCRFKSKDGFLSNAIYTLTNFAIGISKLDKPFVLGGYFLIRKEVFNQCGGFNEELMHCEDYFLSKLVNRHNFKIIRNKVYTVDRRMKKMGFWGMIHYFLKNTANKNNTNYFKKDVGYWN